jgi:hypothetical protein
LPHQLEINLTKNTVLFRIFDHTFQNVRISSNLVKISTLSLDNVGKCIGELSGFFLQKLLTWLRDYLDMYVSIKSINNTDLIFVPKKNSYLHRRIITVADDSGTIDVVLWNNFVRKTCTVSLHKMQSFSLS